MSPYRVPGEREGPPTPQEKWYDIPQDIKDFFKAAVGPLTAAALFLAVLHSLHSCRDRERKELGQKCAKFSSENGVSCPEQCQGLWESGKETGDCSCFADSNIGSVPVRCTTAYKKR